MERVSVIRGKNPIIITAPHGADDINTTVIAESIAKNCDCYAIINRGFEKSEFVDSLKDEANCNRIDHLTEPVVYDEFLQPLLKITSQLVGRIQRRNGYSYGVKTWTPSKYATERILIFHLHGCMDITIDPNHTKNHVGVVVGWGKGNNRDSLTCTEWRKNCFVDFMNFYSGDHSIAYVATPGGKFSGRSKNNLNQYFRKHQNETLIESMQLEFPHWKRSSKDKADLTGMCVAQAINEVTNRDSY